MEIKIGKDDNKTIVSLKGRLDTITSGDLEREMTPLLAEAGTDLILECKDLEYVSSTGLRIILMVHKKLTAGGGSFVLRHVAPSIRSVFDMTGFTSLLTIE